MDAKFNRRFLSFCNSLDALAEARQRDLSDSFVLSGTSAKFSITFDLSWKVMKDILVKKLGILDFAIGSPRDTLRQAFVNGLIQNDEWIQMLRVRNQLAHDYDGTFAAEKFQDVIKVYYPLFEEFREHVKKYYSEEEVSRPL